MRSIGAILICLFTAAACDAGMIVLNPTDNRGGVRTGTSGSFALTSSSNAVDLVGFSQSRGDSEYRIALRFDLPSLPEGATIISARLKMFSSFSAGSPALELHAAAGSGPVEASDMTIDSLIGSAPIVSSFINVDVKEFAIERIDADEQNVLFLLRHSAPIPDAGESYASIDLHRPGSGDLSFPPRLTIVYETAAVPEPGTWLLSTMGLLILLVVARFRIPVRAT